MIFEAKGYYSKACAFHVWHEQTADAPTFTDPPPGYVSSPAIGYLGGSGAWIPRHADVRAGWLVNEDDRWYASRRLYGHPDDFYPLPIEPVGVDARFFALIRPALVISGDGDDAKDCLAALVALLGDRIRVSGDRENLSLRFLIQIDDDPEVIRIVRECGFDTVTLDGLRHYVVKAYPDLYNRYAVRIDSHNPLNFSTLGLRSHNVHFLKRENGSFYMGTDHVTIMDEALATKFDPRLGCLSVGSEVRYNAYSMGNDNSTTWALWFDPLHVEGKLPRGTYLLHARSNHMLAEMGHPMFCTLAFQPKEGKPLKLRLEVRRSKRSRWNPITPEQAGEEILAQRETDSPENRTAFIRMTEEDVYFILVRTSDIDLLMRRAEAMNASPDRKLLNLALPPKATLVPLANGQSARIMDLRPANRPYYLRSDVADSEFNAEVFRRARTIKPELRASRDTIGSMDVSKVELAEDIQFKVADGTLVSTDLYEGEGVVQCPITWVHYLHQPQAVATV